MVSSSRNGKILALFLPLGFDDADRFAVHQQQIITRAGGQRHFTRGYAGTGGEVQRLVILNDPA
jgi:hypothetical protein